MGAATQRFIDALSAPHQVYGYVDVTSPSGGTVRLANCIDGQVSADPTASYRRSATIVVVDASPTGALLPNDSGGILAPLGSEIRPYRGIDYDPTNPGTDVEVYPLGVFDLSSTTVEESVGTAGGSYGTGGGGSQPPGVGSVNTGGIQYSVTMFDRSRKISRDAFTDVWPVTAGTNLVSAIQQILARTIPNLSYDAVGTTRTIPSTLAFKVGDDPWVSATSLATSLGCELYFDVDGDVVIAPPVNVNALPSPSFSYIEGEGNSMTQLDALFTDDPGYNGVIVIGAAPSSTAAPVTAVAWDTEPSSPTYWKGSYGRVPQVVTDSTVTTVAEAQAEADSLLGGLLGFSAQLTATSWCNPALEVGDVVQVKRTPLGVDGLYVLDAFTVPLRGYETQALTLRSNRLIS